MQNSLFTEQQLGDIDQSKSRKEKVRSNAIISACGKYRYMLSRVWDDDAFRPMVAFIMLNPSTADATKDDNTIRRCISFAKDWGYSGIYVANLFAYRATDPKELLSVKDPVGEKNDYYLSRLQIQGNNCDIVFAWGRFPEHIKRMKEVLKIFPFGMAIKVSKEGFPMHPLYLPKGLKPDHYIGLPNRNSKKR